MTFASNLIAQQIDLGLGYRLISCTVHSTHTVICLHVSSVHITHYNSSTHTNTLCDAPSRKTVPTEAVVAAKKQGSQGV